MRQTIAAATLIQVIVMAIAPGSTLADKGIDNRARQLSTPEAR
jgi:hypothetical protein